MADDRSRHVDAVRLDYDARSPRWNHVYDGVSFHDVVLQTRLAIAAAMLAGRVHVLPGPALDVGCGAGQLLAILAAEGQPVAGCDISFLQTVSTRARVGSERAIVVQADAGRLPFCDAVFATATALGLLEYLPSATEGIDELARVVRPGGHVVVSVPNPWRLSYLLDPIGAVVGRVGSTRPGYRRQYLSSRALRKQLTAAGFSVEAMKGHGLGRFALASRPVFNDARSVRISRALEARLPAPVARLLGSNIVAIARRNL
jgi:SAM-dependent methyltransferase